MEITKPSVIQAMGFSAPYPGNFIASIISLTDAMAESGIGSIVVAPMEARQRPWVSEFERREIPIYYVDRQANVRAKTKFLLEVASRHNTQLIHTHFSLFEVSAAIAARIGRFRAIWHARGILETKGFGNTARNIIKRRVLGNGLVHRMVAVSDAVAESLIKSGVSAGKVTTIYNGIDTSRFPHVASDVRERIREENGLERETRIFLFFGRDPYVKGLDVFVSAIQGLPREELNNARFFVVSGEKNADELRKQVEGVASIEVVSPRADVENLFYMADCFVSASRTEAFSFAVGEAMCAGLPVIACGLPWYEPAGAGFLPFPRNDAVGLRKRLEFVLRAKHEDLRELGIRNRNFVTSKFPLSKWTSAMCDLYRAELAQLRSSETRS